MARRVTDISKMAKSSEPLPPSGESVMMPPERSVLNKPVKAKPGDAAAKSAATRGRKAWEATPEGQRRTTSPLEMTDGANMAQKYFINRTDEPEVAPGLRHYDRQLPGMADPNAAPRPPRWEELSPEAQGHTKRALAMRGTNLDQMTRDVGTQLDQAHDRAWKNGAARPWSQNFYEPGSEQRDRIDTSARELGVPPSIHAMTNAFTSPNTKFSVRRADGSTAYPNDEAAVHATRWVQQGNHPDDITNELSTTGTGEKRAQGYVANIRKAANAVSQHLEGVAPGDMKLGQKNVFHEAPKTGPYMNSWSDTTPQFTVADVHTGGGAAFPHLGSDKPIMYDEHGNAKTNASGKEQRGKSEREVAIERTPFAHSAVDFAMRSAMAQRGLPSVRQAQAAQWGEEQLQRGEAGLRGAPRESHVYSGHMGSQFSQIPGQGELALGGENHATRHAAKVDRIREITKHARDEDF